MNYPPGFKPAAEPQDGPISEEAINEAVKAGIYTIGADPIADQIWNGIEEKRKLAQRRNEILYVATNLLCSNKGVSISEAVSNAATLVDFVDERMEDEAQSK